MEFVDYYATMGVEPDASADDIKRRYRKLARRWHPDVSEEPEAEERFKELGEAWTVLKDEQRRAEYDALRAARAAGAGRPGGAEGGYRPPPGWSSGAGIDPGEWQAQGDGDFSDFFEELFGRRARPRQTSGADASGGFRARGEDVTSALSITLAQAFAGVTLPLSLRVPIRRADGSLDVEERTLSTKIPAGTVDGTRLRLRGQGGAGIGGAEAGDLYLEISVRLEERFLLDGRDIITNVDVLPWQAALGASLTVPTLGGDVALKVPEGSAAGRRLRLRGRGLPGSPAGDQYVVLRIVVPKIDERPVAERDAIRAAWRELAKLHGDEIAGEPT